METQPVKALIRQELGFQPTSDQQQALSHLEAFENSRKKNPLYILKGYAGTGKTSLVGAYVKALKNMGKPFVLLAPTGRAAKVLSQYTGFKAHTIHRFIYRIFTAPNGSHRFILAKNILQNAVFIVDEASMINDNSQSGDALFGTRHLLEDLLEFVFSGENNKLVLSGDTAQLPPVGLSISPALNLEYIKSMMSIAGFAFEMKEVMRQSLDSGILATATALRKRISSDETSLPLFDTRLFKTDIIRIESGYDLEELLQENFSSDDLSNCIVVCRTNKRANLFNRQIRERILQRESRIEGGDLLMVVRNNYFWLDDSSKAGFIANGDLIRITRLKKTEEKYGFTFADADIELLDYPDEKEYEVKLLLDTIHAEGPGLTDNDRKRLFDSVEQEYIHIPQRRKRMEKIGKNPYYNALHVKFAYAMTCHKTQGGQWPGVIVDQGYLTDEMINTEYLRWLYTALTRSTDKAFLVNFRPDLFETEE
ncbi:MAG: AAA family ATPase [Chlorobi bacterium]|nr:AAA family ATPase [Chlorobiota bacterium]